MSKRTLGTLLIVIGSFLTFLRPIALLSGETTTTNELTSNTLKDNSIIVDPSLLEPKENFNLPIRVVQPDLSIDLDIKPAKVISGYWEVFEDTAAFGLGSNPPGRKGNTVVFAHARPGLFLPLKEARANMKIYLFTEDSWYQYKIESIKEVLPSDTSVVAPTEDETLTLYTCTGFADSKRLIITAKRLI